MNSENGATQQFHGVYKRVRNSSREQYEVPSKVLREDLVSREETKTLYNLDNLPDD